MAQKKTTKTKARGKTTAKKSTKKPTKKQTTSAAKKTRKKVDNGPEIMSQRAKPDRELAVSSHGTVSKTKAPVRKELWVLVFTLISIFLMLGVLEFAGSVGTFIHNFLCGAFGAIGYAFPVFFGFTTIYLAINHDREGYIAILKVIAILIAYISVCIIASILDLMLITTSSSGVDFYKHGLEGFNGGFIGGTIASAITPVLGNFASAIIFLFLLIMCFVFVTGLSVLRPIKKQGRKIKEAAKEDLEYAKSNREVARQERQYRKRVEREEKLNARRMAIGEEVQAEPKRAVGVDLSVTDLKGTSSEVPFEEEIDAKTGEERARAAAKEFAKTGSINIHRGSGVEVVASPYHDIAEDIEVKKIDPSEASVKIGDEPKIDKPEKADDIADVKSTANGAAAGPITARRTYSTQEELEALDKNSDTFDSTWEETYSVDEMVEEEEIVIPEPEVIIPEEPEVIDVSEPEDIVAAKPSPAPAKATRTNSGSVTFSSGEVKKTRRPRVKKSFKIPPMNLLEKGDKAGKVSNNELRDVATKLEQTLLNFGVSAKVTDISCGPTVTRYELKPDAGVKISKIVALQDDMKLALAASDIRIEAPISGKAAVGIEVPNLENSTVSLRDLLESEKFKNHPSKLAFGVGKDIGGDVVISDISKMPHLLIAGATGSGKSVCLNTIIMSILYRATPEEVKFIMIDPKQVELTMYTHLPHMLVPVVSDVKKAAGALNWGVAEMEQRYNKFKDLGVKDLASYNKKIVKLQEDFDAMEEHEDDEQRPEKLPHLLIVVDEMADLMMVAAHEVEDAICRLAQLARAAGIHLVLATQRPSRQVVTGLIKTNIPSRIALAVSSGIDSRIILDMNGAENLLGKGDMLFAPSWLPKPVRVQGAYVSDEEVAAVVDYWANQKDESALAREKEISREIAGKASAGGESSASRDEGDELFEECGRFVIEAEKASIGNLQRKFRIGFNRAARIMDALSDAGVVGPDEGKKPRDILMTMEEFDELISTMNND